MATYPPISEAKLNNLANYFTGRNWYACDYTGAGTGSTLFAPYTSGQLCGMSWHTFDWTPYGQITADPDNAAGMNWSSADSITIQSLQINLGAFLVAVASDLSVGGSFALTGTMTSGTVPTVRLSGTLQAAQFPALTGDVTTVAGALAATIANNAVTNAKAADMAANTMKANATNATADPADLAITANTFPARSSAGNIAAKTVTDFALTILDDTTQAAVRTTLALTPGTDVQAFDQTLTALAAANWAANALPIGSGADTVAQIAFAANTFPARASTGNLVAKTISDDGLTLVGGANFAAMRTSLGLVIGTNVQAQDAELQAIAGLASAADKVPYFTGSGTAALADFTTAGRALVDDASAAAQRATLGLFERYKTADETVINNTLQDDDHLVWNALPVGVYEVEGMLNLSVDATTGIKMCLTATTATIAAGSFVLFDIQGATAATLIARGIQTAFNATTTVGANGTISGAAFAFVSGTIEVTVAGNVVLQWAQFTTGAKTICQNSKYSRITLKRMN